MTFVDTSILVAAFGRWHERHEDARLAVERADSLPAHALLETYAVLTGMPPPRRAPGRLVLDFLAAHFPNDRSAGGDHPGSAQRVGCVAPHTGTYQEGLGAIEGRGLIGGAVFDGLVAATAKQAGATLLTFDQRAAETYRAVQAPFELL